MRTCAKSWGELMSFRILLSVVFFSTNLWALTDYASIQALYREGDLPEMHKIERAMTGRCFHRDGDTISPALLVPFPQLKTNYRHPEDTGPFSPEFFVSTRSDFVVLGPEEMEAAAKRAGFNITYRDPNAFDRIPKRERAIYEDAARTTYENQSSENRFLFAEQYGPKTFLTHNRSLGTAYRIIGTHHQLRGSSEYFVTFKGDAYCYFFRRADGAKAILNRCTYGWLGAGSSRKCVVMKQGQPALKRFSTLRCDGREVMTELEPKVFKETCNYGIYPESTADEFEIGKAEERPEGQPLIN